MSRALTVTLHIGGQQVDTLTEDQRERLATNLSKAMSVYYTANPKEFVKMEGKGK